MIPDAARSLAIENGALSPACGIASPFILILQTLPDKSGSLQVILDREPNNRTLARCAVTDFKQIPAIGALTGARSMQHAAPSTFFFILQGFTGSRTLVLPNRIP
jgi:hypothetical protein